jgi:hypothetical protein
MRKAGFLVAFLCLLSLGVLLRVVKWRDWPGGPWIDEIYFLRAARLVAAHPEAPLFGTTPLLPPEFTGHGNLYPTNVYLRVVAQIDQMAGGGMASLRAMSIGPALLLFVGSLLVAHEATRHRPSAFLPAGLLLATAIWLLTQARWACDVVSTSALVVLAAATALAAARTRSSLLAILAGVLLGVAQYGYIQSRLAFIAPFAVLSYGLARKSRELARLAATIAGVTVIVAAPLFMHLLANRDRATAHVEDISILSRPPAKAAAAFAANVVDYAALFTHRGDLNPRHGDPARPILLPGISALFFVGLALGFRREGVERFLALLFCLFLAGALLARDTECANASRLSLAAPYVLTLAALGGADLVERLGRWRAPGLAALWAVVLVSATLDVVSFVRWASFPLNWGPFGVPERDVAAALVAETAAQGPAELVLHPSTGARNVYLVDVLLGHPGDGARHAVKTAALESALPWMRVPEADVLYAADADVAIRRAVSDLGAGVVTARRYPSLGQIRGPEWVIYRIPRERAITVARARLDAFPLLGPRFAGNLDANEEGLYQLSTEGGVLATVDGRQAFDGGSGAVVLRLAKGPHQITWRRVTPRGDLTILGPDGFAIPLAAADR